MTALRIRITLATLAVLFAAPRVDADHLRNLKLNDRFPSFEMPAIDGTTVSSRDYRGKVLMLIYMSAEQHSSEQAAIDAAEVMRRVDHKDLALLYVTADVTFRSQLETFRKDAELTHPIAFDTGRTLYGDIGLIVLPTTLIIDRAGKLVRVIAIRKPDYPQTVDAYARHALGLIDDSELEEKLTARIYEKGTPKRRASRHRAVARLLRENGLLESAKRELRAAQELDPDNASVRLDLASIFLEEGRTAEATDIVNAVLVANPDHRQAKLLKGIILFRNGRLDDAEILFKRLLVLNPDPARTHFYLGRIYEQRGEKDLALRHYREALLRFIDDDPGAK